MAENDPVIVPDPDAAMLPNPPPPLMSKLNIVPLMVTLNLVLFTPATVIVALPKATAVFAKGTMPLP